MIRVRGLRMLAVAALSCSVILAAPTAPNEPGRRSHGNRGPSGVVAVAASDERQ
jgi:hypothetical protein